MKKENERNFLFYIDKELFKAFRIECIKEDISTAKALRKMIKDFLQNKDKKI